MLRVDKPHPDSIADVDACLTQLNIIADRRHRLVHRSSTYFEGHLLVTNTLIARALPGESESFTLTELNSMYRDCLSIYVRFLRHSMELTVTDKQMASFYAPWLYKPAPPKAPRQRRQKARKLRKRQRASSKA
jgi:hypothetical protein